MAEKHWMAKATANSHGQFAAKAKKAGKSTRAFAEANVHAKGLLGKQARLALVLMGAKGSGKSNMSEAGDKRTLGQKLYTPMGGGG